MLNTPACLSELHFCPEYFLPQFSHIAIVGQQFVRHFGFFGIAQFGVVLLLAVEAVGGAALFGEGFVDEAAVGGDVQ